MISVYYHRKNTYPQAGLVITMLSILARRTAFDFRSGGWPVQTKGKVKRCTLVVFISMSALGKVFAHHHCTSNSLDGLDEEMKIDCARNSSVNMAGPCIYVCSTTAISEFKVAFNAIGSKNGLLLSPSQWDYGYYFTSLISVPVYYSVLVMSHYFVMSPLLCSIIYSCLIDSFEHHWFFSFLEASTPE